MGSEEIELLPCPFCGARAGKRDLNGIVEAEGHERYMFACPLCLIAQSGNTWQEAAEKWNTRAGLAAEQADQVVDEVQRRMDAVVDAAVEWCESGEEGVSVADSFEKAEALSNAVYRLKQLREKRSINSSDYLGRS